MSLLYRETLNEIMTKGHSRVPVYAGNSKNVIGLILVISFLSVSVIQLIFFFFFGKLVNGLLFSKIHIYVFHLLI